MVNFIICEDDKLMVKKIHTIIDEYMAQKQYEYKIGLISDCGEQVIEYVRNSKAQKNIYIFDISIKGKLNGMQLAKEIRKYDREGELIFLTSHTTMVMYIFKYKLKALDYIDKHDNIRQRLIENFNSILNNMQYLSSKNDYITVKFGSRSYILKFDEIISIQTTNINRKLRITTIDSQIEFYGYLKDIEEEIDSRFCRTHKACIVNCDNIKMINRDKNDLHIIMKNGEKCLLSKRYLKGMEDRNG